MPTVRPARALSRGGAAARILVVAGAASALWSSALAGSAWDARDFSRSLEDRLGHTCEQTRLDAFALHAGAGEAADLRYNEQTGADQRVYPPDRLADHKRMVLRIDIPDMNTPRFDAVQTLTLAPISKPLSTLTLNAVELDIRKVQMNGRDLTFSYDGEALSVTFDPPLPAGKDATITTTYSCTAPVDGLFWLTDDNGMAGRPAQIHTQGQPETNRYWFPCHDFPNERLATELVVTVPDTGFTVSSNGELRDESATNGRRTFHWVLDKPHVNYLVTMVVGKFDVVDVARPGDAVPMPVYVPKGEADKARKTYANTSRMVELFGRLFDEPYPWPRYAQLAVWNFGAGGMENTSATTMYDTAFLDDVALEDADLEGLISHELAHQWFGDYLTCNSWEHIWLNEGFATYLESLWFEERDGFDRGYLYDCWNNMRSAARDRVPAKDPLSRPGLVSNLYEHPDDVFRKSSNPYPKGASTLQMLRAKLGDEAFFGGLRSYVDEHKLGTVRTNNLQEHLEKASGLDLQHFFEQWTVRPGTPEVTTKIDWDESAKALRVVVEQTQPISAEVPAFAFDLPLKISDGKAWRDVVIPVTGKRHETSVPLAADPKMVCVDPELHVLMTPTVKQSRSRIIAQLKEGPTVPSRLDAAVLLEEHPGRETTDALLAVMGDTSEFYAVRARAAETLGKLNKSKELMTALQRGVENPRVRRAAVAAVVDTGDKDALPMLEKVAANDRSYAVRAAAIRGLGDLGGDAQIPVVMSFIDTPSQHDQIRQAALGALADLDADEGLTAAMRYTGPGYLQRTRGAAISAIATLADHDSAKAYDAVAPLLYDSVDRVRTSAAFALARIEDERGVDLFRRAAKNHPHPGIRENAEQWANRLQGRLSGDDVESLQETVGELRNQVRDLEKKLEGRSR